MNKRSKFMMLNFKLLTSVIVLYVCFFLALVSLCNWNMFQFLIARDFPLSSIIKFVFLLMNMWITYIFILALGLYFAKKKYGFVLDRLDEVCHSLNNGEYKQLFLRKKDPFRFFEKTFNHSIDSHYNKRKECTKQIEQLSKNLDLYLSDPKDETKNQIMDSLQ